MSRYLPLEMCKVLGGSPRLDIDMHELARFSRLDFERKRLAFLYYKCDIECLNIVLHLQEPNVVVRRRGSMCFDRTLLVVDDHKCWSVMITSDSVDLDDEMWQRTGDRHSRIVSGP